MSEISLWQAILLALVQGITEFLPVSSSGHLVLPSAVLGWPDQGLAFDVSVHLGSLVAVCHYLRKDIVEIVAALLKQLRGGGSSDKSRMGWMVLIATIPAGLCGLLLDDFIEQNLRTTIVLASTTLLFGVLLGWVDWTSSRHRDEASMTLRDALLIGLAQMLALIPGTSRSGITMTAALALGLQREAAARFSFFLSIPLILAAAGLKSIELASAPDLVNWQAFAVGTVVSVISAWLCIHLFLKWVSSIGLMPFAIYRVVLGLLLFWVVLGG